MRSRPKALVAAAIPTELSDGRFTAPAWAIVALSCAVVVGAAIYLALRLRARSRDRGER